jgi:hypothetical protein
MTIPSTLPATKGVTEALRDLVSAVANMRVPQTTADAGVQVMLTVGPALTAAREALAKHGAPAPGEPGLTSPEAIKNLIGMVRAEAASWREPESYEPRDAVEEAAFLDVIANTLEALSPTAPELGAVKALKWRENPLGNFIAESIVGQYFVFKEDNVWCWVVVDISAWRNFPSPEAAKAAAQSDYESR